MKKPRFKIETWQILFVIAASAFAVIFLNSLAYGFTPHTLLDSIIHTFFIASAVCLGIFYAAPKIYQLSLIKRFVILAVIIFAATIIGLFLTRLFLGTFNNYGIEYFYTPSRRTVIFSLVISYIFGFSTYFYLHSQTNLKQTKELLRQKELAEEKARTLASEAQLASLESRIHPHFLFNTLNSIASLIREDPVLAEKMVEKLSALLRYSLDSNTNGLGSLEKELEITRKYLEIEKVRFGDRLDYTIETAGNPEKVKVPSLSLQTLVENSIKHAASKHSGKTEILVSAVQNERNFIIEVSDNGGGFSENDIKDGHGLDILQRRLATIFDDAATLEIIENGKVRLKIPDK